METIKRFGQDLSRIAFGGVVAMNEDQKDADRYVAEAIDLGVNYFDVAPTYGDAEIKLGHALVGKRDKIFLACKTEDRTKEGARKLLEASLKNLKTDYFDLYQLHAVFNLDDVERIFGPAGAFETYMKAKDQGLIGKIGFSAHSTEAALALMERYDFDSIMFPFNFASMMKLGYGKHVLKKAKEKGMTVLGIKSMAMTNHQEEDNIHHPKSWYHPIDDYEIVKKAVNYSVDQGVDIIIPTGEYKYFKWGVDIANEGFAFNEDYRKELQALADGTIPLFPLKQR